MDDTPTKPPRDHSPAHDDDDNTIPNEEHPGADHPATDHDAAAENRPKYRSWKKKWRKLRVIFDAKMHEAEVLWMQEQKAKATIKRIAVENDRLLDLLSDINASAQIPPEKRIAITSPPPSSPSSPQPHKSLAMLESDVPHMPLSQAKDALPSFQTDTAPAPGEDAPAPFLTVDELENYLYETDQRIGLPKQPTLAPLASQEGADAAAGARDFLVKHPHSAYNWLKVNAPQVFLQGEDEARKERKGAGGRGKKKAKDDEGSGEEDEGLGRKRKRDDGDAGYRPKGGGSRPAKRKRKSEGEVKRRRVSERAE